MRKQTKIKLALMGLGIISAIPVSYAEYVQQNWVLGAEFGLGELSAPEIPLNNMGGTYKTTTINYSFNLGYQWLVSPGLFLGPEFDYFSNGKAKYSGSGMQNDTGSFDINSNAFGLLGNLTYYFHNNFNVFGKLGVAYVTQDQDVNGTVTIVGANGANYIESTTNTRHYFTPVLVGGAGYSIPLPGNTALNVYADVTWIYGNTVNNFSYINQNNYVANGSTIQSIQAKVGIAWLF